MTNQDGLLKRIWTDPVGSALIAAAILGCFALLAGLFAPAKGFLQRATPTPNWVFLVALAVILVSIALAILLLSPKAKKEDLTSSSWFGEIVRQIADCRSARIYLRSFAHPDQFRSEHRDALLKIMQLLKKRLEAGADIEVVAYHYRIDERSGLDWLKSELGTDSEALKRVSLINNQPVSNSSSMYLFDSGVMLYNERNKGDYSYYVQDLQGTVVHHLLEKGYGAVRSACP